MILQRIFNNSGNFVDERYDPYRRHDCHAETHNFLFDEDGNLNEGSLQDDIRTFIIDNHCPWHSDIVKLYWAEQMGMNTKGSYPAIYMWR
jgi:hypothetical protein